MFSRVKILVRFQAWLLGIWRAIQGNAPVDWHDEIDEAVEIINEALDLREQPYPRPRPLTRPMPPVGTAEQHEKVSDQVFMQALKRRRARRQLDNFEM